MIHDEIDAELQTFQWAYPNRGENRGEVWVDRERNELVLEVWVLDNDNPDSDEVRPLIVRIPISEDEEPRSQIRKLIHGYLCHEADEQMWFGDDRPFHPHRVNA